MSVTSKKVYNMYERRQAIPIIYVRGTHYDVGYDVVRKWKMFKQVICTCSSLNKIRAIDWKNNWWQLNSSDDHWNDSYLTLIDTVTQRNNWFYIVFIITAITISSWVVKM